MAYVDKRSGTFSFKVQNNLKMSILEEGYIKPKCTQISKWRGIFWLQVTTICSFENDFLCQVLYPHTHTHNTQHTHHTHNTHITQLNLTDGYMDLTYSHKLSCELWFNNKCMSKEKLVVVWIYSMLLIYSFFLLQFWLINYWIVIINILIYLTNMIWEKVV